MHALGKPQDIEDQKDVGGENDTDLPLVDMSTISIATDNFSIRNKIGQGGFGPVYKVIQALTFVIIETKKQNRT